MWQRYRPEKVKQRGRLLAHCWLAVIGSHHLIHLFLPRNRYLLLLLQGRNRAERWRMPVDGQQLLLICVLIKVRASKVRSSRFIPWRIKQILSMKDPILYRWLIAGAASRHLLSFTSSSPAHTSFPSSTASFSYCCFSLPCVVMPTSQETVLSWIPSGRVDQLMSGVVQACSQNVVPCACSSSCLPVNILCRSTISLCFLSTRWVPFFRLCVSQPPAAAVSLMFVSRLVCTCC